MSATSELFSSRNPPKRRLFAMPHSKLTKMHRYFSFIGSFLILKEPLDDDLSMIDWQKAHSDPCDHCFEYHLDKICLWRRSSEPLRLSLVSSYTVGPLTVRRWQGCHLTTVVGDATLFPMVAA